MIECENCGAWEGDFVKLLNVWYDNDERMHVDDKIWCCRCFLEGKRDEL